MDGKLSCFVSALAFVKAYWLVTQVMDWV